MATLFQAFLSGVVANNPLATGGTSLSATALANMPVVASPNTMWITLDPNGVNGLPEIVQVTAHTASATTCTIVRGQQTTKGGNAAHAHIQNTPWVVAETPADVARTASFGAGGVLATTSGTAELTSCTLVVPDQGVNGTLMFWGRCLTSKSSGGDIFYCYIRDGSSNLVGASRSDYGLINLAEYNVQGTIGMSAGSSATLNMVVFRVFGSGTATVTNDSNYNNIIALFVPS